MAMTYAIKSLDLGGILDQAAQLTKNHFKMLLTIAAYMYIPLNLVQNLIVIAMIPTQPPPQGASPEVLVQFLLLFIPAMIVLFAFLILSGLIAWPVTNAAAIQAMASEYLGTHTTAADSVRAAFKKLGAVLGTGFLAGLFILLGTLCCIIPGIYLSMKYFFAMHVVVIENKSGTEALKRSGELMKNNYGTAFILGFILAMIGVTAGSFSNMIPVQALQVVIQVLVSAAITIFSAAAGVVFYFSCRCKLENFDLTVLADAVKDEGSTDAPASPGAPGATGA